MFLCLVPNTDLRLQVSLTKKSRHGSLCLKYITYNFKIPGKGYSYVNVHRIRLLKSIHDVCSSMVTGRPIIIISGYKVYGWVQKYLVPTTGQIFVLTSYQTQNGYFYFIHSNNIILCVYICFVFNFIFSSNPLTMIKRIPSFYLKWKIVQNILNKIEETKRKCK